MIQPWSIEPIMQQRLVAIEGDVYVNKSAEYLVSRLLKTARRCLASTVLNSAESMAEFKLELDELCERIEGGF